MPTVVDFSKKGDFLKFIYSEKATKFCEILLTFDYSTLPNDFVRNYIIPKFKTLLKLLS
jgi:hypothetical protein